MAGAAVLERLTWQIGAVVEISAETARVRSLSFDIATWPGHQPGQHVDVRLTAEDGYQAVRSYSIASPPEESHVVLTVEKLEDGEVSPYLVDDVLVGDQLEFRGPVGGYFIWNSAQGGPLLLIAGGSGIVPLMAMIRHRIAVGSTAPIRLTYSTRSAAEIIYADELTRLAEQSNGIDVIHTFTRSQPDGWSGFSRRIDLPLLDEVAWRPDDHPLAYVCGPTPFVETVATAMTTLGHAPARVKTERFGATGG